MDDLIAQRRSALAAETEPGDPTLLDGVADPHTSLAGLALSGGGIRSATFALGVLQALGERRLLWVFDYLSTVSGGGYIGGWWSAWLSRPDRTGKEGMFPGDERLEPDRFPALLFDADNQAAGPPKNVPSGTPDGSRSALLRDPIHHVRLFSNYLTPRKGVLSADSWRAATTISRNLVLTWIILLPLLMAAVIVGQLYFAADSASGFAFVCSRPDRIAADTSWRVPGDWDGASRIREIRLVASPRLDQSPACQDAVRARDASVATGTTHREVLERRLRMLSGPLVAALLLVGALIVLWMLYGSRDLEATLIGFVIVLVTASILATGSDGSASSGWTRGGLIVAVLVILFGLGPALRGHLQATSVGGDRMRNLVVRWHARVLVLSVIGLAVLLAAGFGHELAWWAFEAEGGRVPVAAREAGGWAALALAVGSGLFTILRAGPSSKGKDAAAESPGRLTTLVIAVAPMLVLAALVVSAAALGRKLYSLHATFSPATPLRASLTTDVMSAAVVGVMLLALYALFEWVTAPRSGAPRAAIGGGRGRYRRDLLSLVLLVAAFVLVTAGLTTAIVLATRGSAARVGMLEASAVGVYAMLAAIGLLVTLHLKTVRDGGSGGSLLTRSYASSPGRRDDDARVADLEAKAGSDPRARDGLKRARDARAGHRLRGVAGSIVATLAAESIVAAWVWTRPVDWLADPVSGGGIRVIALGGIALSLAALIAGGAVPERDSRRAAGLVGLVALFCGAIFTLHYLPPDRAATAFTIFGVGLTIVLTTGVIALGWMTDPNLVALHNFYKARLVRAYLGASNARQRRDAEITETAPMDDMRLADLGNHVRGAPLHVINTTLNLVGGRDLSTAQRFAAPFTMSSEICGSARTGYHRTTDYMAGELTLGTAVATSGAAVSTNMGSKSVSSALALLLALFNIRLGLWAPTPNRERWREQQARLWPFYLLREALSQTNELGTYCYLTDGGHFDNTGLYSLVERGCRYILVLDDGADVSPCFSDMGEAIRRCRIDFGAEITFPDGIDTFEKAKDGGLVQKHHVRGAVRYARPHLRMLGWTEQEIDSAGEGVLIWIKPNVSATNAIDVRQYKLENADFPQQTTTDQWYDESQFESYRALGYQTLAARLDEMKATTRPAGTDLPRGFADVDGFFRTL